MKLFYKPWYAVLDVPVLELPEGICLKNINNSLYAVLINVHKHANISPRGQPDIDHLTNRVLIGQQY